MENELKNAMHTFRKILMQIIDMFLAEFGVISGQDPFKELFTIKDKLSIFICYFYVHFLHLYCHTASPALVVQKANQHNNINVVIVIYKNCLFRQIFISIKKINSHNFNFKYKC